MNRLRVWLFGLLASPAPICLAQATRGPSQAPADHFAAWIALGGSVLTLIGTFGALMLTRYFEAKRERVRTTREDKARFQARRAEAYADYFSTTSVLLAAADGWYKKKLDFDIIGQNRIADHISEARGPYLTAFSRVSLVASPPVLEKIKRVHSSARMLLDADSVDEVGRLLNEVETATAAYFGAVRAELGE